MDSSYVFDCRLSGVVTFSVTKHPMNCYFVESVTRIHNQPGELGQLQVSCSATNAYVNQQDNVKCKYTFGF